MLDPKHSRATRPYHFKLYVYNYPSKKKQKKDKKDKTVSHEKGPHQNEFLGLNRLFDQNHKESYKCLWLMIVLTCTVCCVYQISQRVISFFEGKIILETTVKPQISFQFPSVMLCGTDMFSKFGDNKFHLNSPIDNNKLWNELGRTKVEELKMFTWCENLTENGACLKPMADYMIIDSVITMLGNCAILTMKNKMLYRGPDTYISIIGNITTRTNGTPEETTEFIFSVYKDSLKHVHDSLLTAECAVEGYVTTYRMYAREFINLNTTNNPCSSHEEAVACINNCIDDQLSKILTCGLPHVKSKLPECGTFNETVENYWNANEIFFSMDYNEECRCNRKCTETKYTLYKDSERKNITTGLRLIAADDTHETVREREAFPGSALMSDVGGTIGFYLGISIFAIVDLFEFLIRHFCYKHLKRMTQ